MRRMDLATSVNSSGSRQVAGHRDLRT